MKKIRLTNGKYTLVDNEDFYRFGKMRWRMDYHGYVIISKQIDGKIKTLLLHREIMKVSGIKGIDIDHIDGKPLNNQKSNLRKCSRSENAVYSKIRKNNTSGYKGVHLRKCCKYKKWVSRITKNGNKIILGYFYNPIDAAKAYDKKAIELFGPFAKTNF